MKAGGLVRHTLFSEIFECYGYGVRPDVVRVSFSAEIDNATARHYTAVLARMSRDSILCIKVPYLFVVVVFLNWGNNRV